ncbi:sensor domain-containing diguanylate cyclase [Pleionea mediterranea]|uniref:PAS domain S-box-containing protein/diguanylate cyclase (GGDEF)-like protein n=1 Tax=Pleionea mediterranea TaxID=523701 RepID=A0A316FNQ7_9GAMM|nr:sensor domain-containing diguanylate cyclase [Pleionea mediterranea]PWK49310.1 PAS domain S-box-containing protein/diguanylate cyclase (GGDEF)-like protein [Pleionea mediterranea]
MENPKANNRIRRILQSEDPDLSEARQWFLAANNHPDDIDGMIRFFLRFEKFPYMKQAIKKWEQGDGLILKLEKLGEQLRHAKQTENSARLITLLSQLAELNAQLTQVENEFSHALTEGALWVKKVLTWSEILLLMITLIPAFFIAYRIIIQISTIEKALQTSDQRFRGLSQSSMMGIIGWRFDGTILDANDAFLDMIGYSQQDLKEGRINWRKTTPKEFWDADDNALDEINKDGVCKPFEKEFMHKEGHRVPVLIGAVSLDDNNESGICFFIDLTDKKLAEEQMRLSATVFNATNNGILVCDTKKKIVAVNSAFCNMSGFKEKQILGMKAEEFIADKLSSSQKTSMDQSLKKIGRWSIDNKLITNSGAHVDIQLSVNAVMSDTETITHYALIFIDISERIESEKKLIKAAHYDFLTGLANRILFTDRHKKALLRAKRNNQKVALLFFDLDNFKPINDQYGHNVGDELLIIIGSRLEKTIRESDTIARLGGDEFAILLEDVVELDAVTFVAQKVIDIVNQPVEIDGVTMQVGCSLGISVFPEDSDSTVQMISNADSAMYDAKNNGRNRYSIYKKSDSKNKH